MELTGPKPTKVCRDCGLTKDLTDFYYHKSTKDKLRPECKLCISKYQKDYWKNNGYKYKERRSKYHYEYTYGISKNEVLCMKELQNYKCFICEEEHRLIVDHSHKTGKIRKLLCDRCNQGLGSFRDNSVYLRKAADYLELEH